MTREIKTVHILRVRDLCSYVCSVFVVLNKRTTYVLEHPEREVNILIGGDKGGSYTKFHFEIVAPGIVSSAYNVHIFAMFEDINSRQNMLKVLEPFEPLLYLEDLRLRFFLMGISKCWIL